MKVGDLVRYVPASSVWDDLWKDYRGLIIRNMEGWPALGGYDKRVVVLWMNGDQQTIPERNLEVVSESR